MISIQFNYYRRGIRGTTSADTSRGKGNPATDNSNPEAYPSSYPGRRILTLLIRHPSRGTAVRDGMRQDLAIRLCCCCCLIHQKWNLADQKGSVGSSRAVLGASWSESEGSRGKASGPRFRGKRPDTDLGPSSPGRRSRGWSLDSKSQGFGYGVALDLSCHFQY